MGPVPTMTPEERRTAEILDRRRPRLEAALRARGPLTLLLEVVNEASEPRIVFAPGSWADRVPVEVDDKPVPITGPPDCVLGWAAAHTMHEPRDGGIRAEPAAPLSSGDHVLRMVLGSPGGVAPLREQRGRPRVRGRALERAGPLHGALKPIVPVPSKLSMARSKKSSEAVDAVIEGALGILRADPARLKALLRKAADLADDVAGLLSDAQQEDASDRVRHVAKRMRGAAFLPAVLAVPLLRKALVKIVAAAG